VARSQLTHDLESSYTVLDHLGRSEPAVLLHYRSVRVDSHRAWELNSEASTELLVDKGRQLDGGRARRRSRTVVELVEEIFYFLFKGLLLREEDLSKILPPFHNIRYFRFVKQMYLDII
jgi:hypothetical protein